MCLRVEPSRRSVREMERPARHVRLSQCSFPARVGSGLFPHGRNVRRPRWATRIDATRERQACGRDTNVAQIRGIIRTPDEINLRRSFGGRQCWSLCGRRGVDGVRLIRLMGDGRSGVLRGLRLNSRAPRFRFGALCVRRNLVSVAAHDEPRLSARVRSPPCSVPWLQGFDRWVAAVSDFDDASLFRREPRVLSPVGVFRSRSRELR